MLYGTDRVINHFADKSFAEQVEALQEECLKRSDPDNPRYSPYCMEWYDIDYENRRVTKRDSREVMNRIRQIERENDLNRIYPDWVKYGLISDEEIKRKNSKGKYVGTGKYQLQSYFVRLMVQSKDSVIKKGKDIYQYEEYERAMLKYRRMKTNEYYYGTTYNSVLSSSNANNSTIEQVNMNAENMYNDAVSYSEKSSDKVILTTENIELYNNKINSIVISNYAFNSIELSNLQKKELDTIAEQMLENTELNIKIIGHTCDIGSVRANQSVGMKRANIAKDYLVAKGVDSERIQVFSAGSSLPLEPNTSSVTRGKNRRISSEIINFK